MTDQTPKEPTQATTKPCPLCRLPMKQKGKIAAFEDVLGQAFGFAICAPCRVRLDRLPLRLQGRQLDVAIRNLEKHPDRYEIQCFESMTAARLFVALEAERLQN